MPAPLHLEFSLGDDRYLLPVERIAQVLPLPALKALPGAPEGVAGVLNHHGRAVLVIDLVRLACGRAAAERRATRLVLVHYPVRAGCEETRLLGVIVERATTVRRAAAEGFAPVGAPAAAWLGGVAATGGATLAQRVEVEALLSAELRAGLFDAAEQALDANAEDGR